MIWSRGELPAFQSPTDTAAAEGQSRRVQVIDWHEAWRALFGTSALASRPSRLRAFRFSSPIAQQRIRYLTHQVIAADSILASVASILSYGVARHHPGARA